VFPNQAPWPGRFRDSIPVKSLDAGRARELQKCAQPATQMLSVHCLYQVTGKSARRYLIFRRRVYRNGTPGTRPTHPSKAWCMNRRNVNHGLRWRVYTTISPGRGGGIEEVWCSQRGWFVNLPTKPRCNTSDASKQRPRA